MVMALSLNVNAIHFSRFHSVSSVNFESNIREVLEQPRAQLEQPRVQARGVICSADVDRYRATTIL